MSGLALALVLAGAVCHALWNVAAKKAGGGAAFVFLFNAVSVAAYVPVTIWAWTRWPQHFSGAMWFAAAASALIHTFYALVLQKSYREADFAVVYPVARGTGPMLSVLIAILLFTERPSLVGWLSVGAILMGLFVSAGGAGIWRGGAERRRLGLLWGMTTGAFIAAYTVLDGWAIKTLGMVPILFYAACLFIRMLLQAPFSLRRPGELRREWRAKRAAILTIGLLSPAAYSLVLFALQRAPLSYVAPVREISMLLGAFFGASLLHEEVKPSQIAGAAIMLAGVVGLAWA
ncbi:MAG: DMT family transporter [Candidatus Accumulibacter sp.]|jgi:drug/metabolite transporter (DMT)-like permease|nr:DMT family transporter [Accumulibacter sp.]